MRLGHLFAYAGGFTVFLLLILVASCTQSMEQPTTTPPPPTTSGTCVSCHTDRGTLAKLANPLKTPTAHAPYGEAIPDVARADRLLVSPSFLDSTHGKIPCQGCHNGRESSAVEEAHTTLVRDPSKDRIDVCAACHRETMSKFGGALHNTLKGEGLVVGYRYRDAVLPDRLATYMETSCSSCHVTCGQCHVSRPNQAMGGLLEGHEFARKPPVNETCMQCHGTGTAGEGYTGDGNNQGDVHWTKARMTCTDCHKAAELHGEGGPYTTKRTVEEMPQCTDCHSEKTLNNLPQHFLHVEKLSCATCHAASSITSCFNCHVSDQGSTYEQQLTFKIGRNVKPDARHPYAYEVVRHVPVTRDTFSILGVDPEEFDSIPTWKRAVPHNIQRVTTQTQSCNSCHGNKERFLTRDDLLPGDSKANGNVVTEPPKGF